VRVHETREIPFRRRIVDEGAKTHAAPLFAFFYNTSVRLLVHHPQEEQISTVQITKQYRG
jgi:hypothetical protein